MSRFSHSRNRSEGKCVPITEPETLRRGSEKSAFDVKVVECEVSSAPDRWRELVSFLLEVDAAQ